MYVARENKLNMQSKKNLVNEGEQAMLLCEPLEWFKALELSSGLNELIHLEKQIYGRVSILNNY